LLDRVFRQMIVDPAQRRAQARFQNHLLIVITQW
jgi:hypothetical protein